MKGEHEDDPYMPMNRWYRRGVKVKYYDGDEKFQDPFVGDEKSFGDNDYIDFFTDDRIHPIENVQGPDWLRATKLHDYDILRNRVKYEGDFLKEFRPMKYEK
ncbi:MAG: 39S ribosomal protein L51, mitochondrial, partial [Paramarteilia canceri]